jgi:hypothetical protein
MEFQQAAATAEEQQQQTATTATATTDTAGPQAKGAQLKRPTAQPEQHSGSNSTPPQQGATTAGEDKLQIAAFLNPVKSPKATKKTKPS